MSFFKKICFLRSRILQEHAKIRKSIKFPAKTLIIQCFQELFELEVLDVVSLYKTFEEFEIPNLPQILGLITEV